MSGVPSPFRSPSAKDKGAGATVVVGGPGSPRSPEHAGATHAPATQLAPPVQTTGFPPTHTPTWQVSVRVHMSPSAHAVPAGAKSLPHFPWVHARHWHTSSVPAQSAGARHSTQVPIPSHWVPPTE